MRDVLPIFQFTIEDMRPEAVNGIGVRIGGRIQGFPWLRISRYLGGIPTVRIDLFPHECCPPIQREPGCCSGKGELATGCQESSPAASTDAEGTGNPASGHPQPHQDRNPGAAPADLPAGGSQTATGFPQAESATPIGQAEMRRESNPHPSPAEDADGGSGRQSEKEGGQ